MFRFLILFVLSLFLFCSVPTLSQACGTSGTKIDRKNKKVPYALLNPSSKTSSNADSNCLPSNLFLNSKPQGARVIIDQKEVPLKTPFIIEAFPEGSHHFKVEAPGIPAYEFDMNAYEYSQKDYLIDLKERKITNPEGDSDFTWVSFYSRPKGATLTLNNEAQQNYKTPLRLRLKKNENYEYKLELAGFKPVTGKIKEGNPPKVSVELVPLPQ